MVNYVDIEKNWSNQFDKIYRDLDTFDLRNDSQVDFENKDMIAIMDKINGDFISEFFEETIANVVDEPKAVMGKNAKKFWGAIYEKIPRRNSPEEDKVLYIEFATNWKNIVKDYKSRKIETNIRNLKAILAKLEKHNIEIDFDDAKRIASKINALLARSNKKPEVKNLLIDAIQEYSKIVFELYKAMKQYYYLVIYVDSKK